MKYRSGIHRWLCAVLALATSVPVSAGWLPLGSPVRPGAILTADAPEVVYAQVSAPEGSYLWRSDDGGSTWHSLQIGLERPVSALGVDPADAQILWAWTVDGQLWRSTDAGGSWAQRFATAPSDTDPLPRVAQLLADPRHLGTVYRVELGSESHVAVSRDGGATFKAGASIPLRSRFDGIFLHLRGDELLSFDEKGLEFSADGGQTWHVRSRPFRRGGFAGGSVAPSAPDVLYGLPFGLGHCVTRSDDAGAHWQTLAYPPIPSAHSSCTAVAIDPRDARHVWVAAEVYTRVSRLEVLMESQDGGRRWSRPFPLPALGVVAAGGSVLYTSISNAAEGKGISVSRDGGRTWSPADRGIATGELRRGFVAQGSLFGLNTPPSGTELNILSRSPNGRDWEMLSRQQPTAVAGAGGSALVAVDSRGVLWSPDAGNTWNLSPSAPAPRFFGFGTSLAGLRANQTQPQFVALLVFEADENSGKIALWISPDRGATWRRSSDGLPIACGHYASIDVCPRILANAYAVDPFHPNRQWIAFGLPTFPFPQTSIFRSEDAGLTWHVVTADLPALALVPDPKVEGRLLAGTDGGLFVSQDGGAHWLLTGSGLPDDVAIPQLLYDARSATWYAATAGAGIYRSLDGGAQWTLLAGAPDLDAPAIALDPGDPTALLAAFRSQGAWRWTP
ncbi:MAG: hypothetical protein QOF89_892 [Acidobacteriota bacterium]|jgi:photosystem II stability/assembly factor-like uncharacterized protein|nr:hypothetical protein [Acidobacteriota bacterium]